MSSLNTVVMVPKGAEFKAVQKGLLSASATVDSLKLVSLPVGPVPVKTFLNEWCKENRDVTPETAVILMGLCGSLTPRLKVNDAVVYERCIDGVSGQPEKTLLRGNDLSVGSTKISVPPVTPVTGVMCDRVIAEAAEKCQIGKQFNADVVDMESFAALEILHHQVQSVSMLRVVSDDAEHDVPNLSDAFDSKGNIKPWVMTLQFLRQPVGALRLIKGSLSALNQLKNLAYGVGNQHLAQKQEPHQN